jgi:hypothetical protein
MTSPRPNADRPTESNGDRPSPGLGLGSLFAEVESGLAQALERAVAGPSFAVLLGYFTENVIALSKIAADSADLAVSSLRIAGRRDVVRLERQLGRAEDKLEILLQELEGLRTELARGQPPKLAQATDAA